MLRGLMRWTGQFQTKTLTPTERGGANAANLWPRLAQPSAIPIRHSVFSLSPEGSDNSGRRVPVGESMAMPCSVRPWQECCDVSVDAACSANVRRIERRKTP
jgi:hypothetical protein